MKHDLFLYEKIAEDFASLIRAGTLRPGDRLPSVRQLRRQKGVSLATVLQAYSLLEDRDYVRAKPQSGYYVKARLDRLLAEPHMVEPPSHPSEVTVADLAVAVSEAVAHPQIVPLGAAIPSSSYLPSTKFYRILSSLARNATIRQRTPAPLGYEGLRQQISRRYFDWGSNIPHHEILITCGCTEALNLSLWAVAKPGDVIAVESPTYFGMLQMVQKLGMKVLEIPTHPRNGMDLNALEKAVQTQGVKACLITPNFNNPLGTLMPEENKKQLAELSKKYQLPLIEDGIFNDLHFSENTPKSLKAYDSEGLVLQCGSFSKTLGPELGMGWVTPGRFLKQVKSLKFANTGNNAVPVQAALAEFLRHGGYQRHLRGMRRDFATNVERFSLAVAQSFPTGTKITRPQGGFVLWVELPKNVNALDLFRRALAEKISIAPGPMFSARGAFQHHIRLNCGYPWSDQMDHAIKRLGELMKV